MELLYSGKGAGHMRAVCMLAHVDHGKTTLSDALLAAGGVLSEHLSGEARYLDCRTDEQQRGITMKTAAFSMPLPDRSGDVIHLLDSPGHVDFGGEVSGAVRLADGALVLVDALEGVCIQTRVVLQQAFTEKLRLCLVFTKIDRLILEAKMTPSEAYTHLYKLLEQTNAIVSALQHLEHLKRESAGVLGSLVGDHKVAEDAYFDEDRPDDSQYFLPEKGNVMFSSSYHRWAFTIEDFAALYSKKLGMNENVLKKTLWGGYFYDPKKKRFFNKPQNLAPVPFFVQMIAKPIWDVYTSIYENDNAKLLKILTALNIIDNVNPTDVMNPDRGVAIREVMSKWIPVGNKLVNLIMKQLPSPEEAQKERVDSLLMNFPLDNPPPNCPEGLVESATAFKKALVECDGRDDAPLLVFIVKMFSLECEEYRMALRGLGHTAAVDPSDRFIAVARVFSGVLKPGQEVYVLAPGFDPMDPTKNAQKVSIGNLFLLMGQSIEPVRRVSAGNICGISGLGKYVAKTATLASSPLCIPFKSLWTLNNNKPIVRVAVEPVNPNESDRLVDGLRLLNQADPSCITLVQETGEHVVIASGELHLERCLKDLRETYARIDINVSAPIVPFRETVSKPVLPPDQAQCPYLSCASQPLTFVSPTGTVTFVIRVAPLPESVVTVLEQHVASLTSAIENLDKQNRVVFDDDDSEQQAVASSTEKVLSLAELKELLMSAFEKESEQWKDLVECIWSFGPKRVGANIIFNKTDNKITWTPFFEQKLVLADDFNEASEMESTLLTGFQLAAYSGPLCNEPMRGVAFIVEDVLCNIVETSESPALVAEVSAKPVSPIISLDKLVPKEEVATENVIVLDEESEEEKEEEVVVFSLDDDFLPAATEPTESGEAKEEFVIIEEEEFDATISDIPDTFEPMKGGVFVGRNVTFMSECFKKAFMACAPRLQEPMYLCEVQVSSEMLGKMYSVLHKRRAKVLSEDISYSSSTFIITAHLPVADSFGLADEILKKTSGDAIPQLMFDCFETVDVDPFFVPTTEEELEEFGDGVGGIPPNVAKKFIDMTRKRKGLAVNEKLIEHADKQRTRSRKK